MDLGERLGKMMERGRQTAFSDAMRGIGKRDAH